MHSCALITTTRVTVQRRNWLESNHAVAMAAQPSPHISFNTNKYNILWELAHHTKRRLCTAKILEAFCCFRSVASVWKLSEFKPIIPPDSNTQRRLHYFASHDMQWTRPSFFFFFALLDTKSSGSPASVHSGPFCSTQQCQTHPALSPLLICCPILSVFQQ